MSPSFPKPSGFPSQPLPHSLEYVLSKVNDRKLLYLKCRADAPTFPEASVVDCDIVALVHDGDKLVEESIGKAYAWENGEKYVVYLPKFVYYYSSYENGRPFDDPNPSRARYFVVEHL